MEEALNVRGQYIWTIALPSSQFCHGPKPLYKNKFFIKKNTLDGISSRLNIAELNLKA